MDKVLEALTSPLWWFTVVVVGIVVNLVASYLKTHADQFFIKISDWWRDKSNKRKQEYDAKIATLVSSQSERTKLAFMCNRSLQHSIHFMLFSVLVPVFYLVSGIENNAMKIFVLGFSAIAIFMSFLAFNSSIKERILLFSILSIVDKNDS